jgi:hypothetical protein
MKELNVSRLSEWDEEETVVRKWSTVLIAKNTYSVPSRLIGRTVRCRVYEDHIEVYFNGVRQLTVPRLRGRGRCRINYRHIIYSLIRKPGAFREYRYRKELFPTLNFRKAYDSLCEACSERVADMEYLRILKLSADEMESMVDNILGTLLEKGVRPRWATVEEFMPSERGDPPPDAEIAPVNLNEYDHLIGRELS